MQSIKKRLAVVLLLIISQIYFLSVFVICFFSHLFKSETPLGLQNIGYNS